MIVVVMHRSNRLRLALVLLALLPGLLFQGGGSLHVCLHDWMDIQDACQEGVTASAPSPGGGGSCCTGERAPTEGPVLADGHDCQGCCIELSSEGAELPAPPASLGEHAPCLAAPAHWASVAMPAPPVRPWTPRAVVSTSRLPGRAPTPLRI